MNPLSLRTCLVEPVPAVFEGARMLDAAVTAHLENRIDDARALFHDSNAKAVRDWTESLWGGKSERFRVSPKIVRAPFNPEDLDKSRMLPKKLRDELIKIDGRHCRFCGIPVIRAEVRTKIRRLECYRDVIPWGKKNSMQHAAFQAMWLQYDHIVPHSLGGPSTVENMVITCAPCNFGRMENTLAEFGLLNPRDRKRQESSWDGLERFK